jgi:hypothetical protein
MQLRDWRLLFVDRSLDRIKPVDWRVESLAACELQVFAPTRASGSFWRLVDCRVFNCMTCCCDRCILSTYFGCCFIARARS